MRILPLGAALVGLTLFAACGDDSGDGTGEEGQSSNDPSSPPASPADGDPVSYEAKIHPIMVAKCGGPAGGEAGCHGGVKPIAGPMLGSSDLQASQTGATDFIERILTRAGDGSMPPPKSMLDPVTQEELALILAWKDGGFLP